MNAPVVVAVHVSRGIRPGVDLTIHNAQELSEDELRGMFPNIEAMLRDGLRRLKTDADLLAKPGAKMIAKVTQ
jgi:hypothetical protein